MANKISGASQQVRTLQSIVQPTQVTLQSPVAQTRRTPLDASQLGVAVQNRFSDSTFAQSQGRAPLRNSQSLFNLQISQAKEAGTSLMDINLRDQQIDLCLEEALNAAGPGDAQVFLYGDSSDGVGHAVSVNAQGHVMDHGKPALHPQSGQPLTLGQWEGMPQNQRYNLIGAAQAAPLREALEQTAPGSLARGEALESLGLGGIAQARVADPPNLLTTANLNVRSGPGGTRLGTFPAGAELATTGNRDGQWVEVSGDINGSSVSGWVHSGYTKEVEAPSTPTEPAKPSLATTANLNVRSGPGGTRLGTFPAGAELATTGNRDGQWVEVSGDINGSSVSGWVHSGYVRSIENTPTTPAQSGPEKMRDAAQTLVDRYAENYGVEDAWVNIDPNHALPTNVSLGGLRGKWKCNLFAGNTMAQAGFDPPYYGNRGRGEYPNANQLYKWSDKYAGRYNNKTHFEMRGELDVQSLSGDARRAAIEDLLKTAEPGDMIIVDHMGSDVADGGHCRVVVANDLANGGTIDCAQASSDSALVRNETISRFTGEETIWILRPNKPRE